MGEGKFKDSDVEQYVAALNFIATNANFKDMDIKSIIECRNHFAHLQSMIEKIKANILEVKSVKQVKKDK